MSAVYPYHPDRPRNMINTNKLFDQYYAAEDSEETIGATSTKTSTSAPVVLTKPTRSALIKRRKGTTAAKPKPKAKRQIPARLKLFWDEEGVTKTSFQTTSFQSTQDTPIIHSSSKSESLPIRLQAASVIDSNFSTTTTSASLPKLTLQLDRFQAPQQRTRQYEPESPQTSFIFSFPQSKSDSDSLSEEEEKSQQSAQDTLSSLEQFFVGPLTYQHLIYLICLGAIIAFVWSHLLGAIDQTQTQQQDQHQHQQHPLQDLFQTQIESPYFPSSSFTLTSAVTLTPSLSAVRIFVGHQRNQFSFTLLRTRLFAR